MRVETYWASLQQPQTAPAAHRGLGSRALSVLTWCLVVVLACAALLAIGLRVAGIQPLAVLSGSMRPTIEVADLVLVKPIPALDARPGHIVTFDSPDRPGVTITHRVVSVRDEGARLAFVTRGDANSASERWYIEREGTVGKHLTTIPRAGRLSALVGSPQLRAATLGLATLIALGSLMWWIWRPKRPTT
jgi:signal peptidase I